VTDSFIGFQTRTDTNGFYRFSNLPSHRYCLSAKQQAYWWTLNELCQESMIRTAGGRDLERNISLDRAPTLRGQFLDTATNTPIGGPQRVILKHAYIGGIRQWSTSYGMIAAPPSGQFRLSPPRGEFYLEIVPDHTEKFAVAAGRDASATTFYGRTYYPGVS